MDSLIVFAFWAFILFKFRAPIIALIKMIMEAQSTSHQTGEYPSPKQTQENTDLQTLLNKLDNYNESAKTKKSKHVHSNSNYSNKSYVQDKPHALEMPDEKTVKRSMFDNRDTEPTIIRKDYD